MSSISRRAFAVGSLCAPGLLAANGESAPVAETQYGKVRGYSLAGIQIFRGIPYGGPTEGSNRFLPPAKPAKWAGVRDVTATGPRCIQAPGVIFLNPVIGEYFAGGRADRVELAQQQDSENCLGLNVLTPGLRGKRPVMVYIHGGGFTGGSSLLTLYADQFPREQDVVLVGVNHRLNVFGYTYLGGLSEKYATGNAGQLDLIAALQWVRDNIAAFGGDPSNVTIFGESGGGAKISTLLAMPAAKGLFHKATVQSGSLLRVSTPDEATARARALLDKLGISANKLDELEKLPADKLFAAASGRGPGGSGGPVIDGHSILQQTWEPDAPAMSANIPMIIGSCKDESTLFARNDDSLFHLDEAGLRQRVIKAGIPEEKVASLLEAYRKTYPRETPTDIYFRISTDRGVRWNALRQAEKKVAQGGAKLYVYDFVWDTPLDNGRIKAFHTADLPLTMRLVQFPDSLQVSKQLSAAWAAFARTGNPGTKDLAWPAYNVNERPTMIFDGKKSGVVNDPDREARTLLSKLPSGTI